MSAATGSDQLNLKDHLERIDRAMAETHKFQTESDKLQAESRELLAEQLKLGTEQFKLAAEAATLTWDRKWSPWLLGASLSGGLIVAAFNHFWK